EQLDRGLHVHRHLRELEGEGHVTDVDQVEADDEQVVDGVGQRLVAVEGIHEEDPAVAMERARHPHGERDADGHVDQIAPDGVGIGSHLFPPAHSYRDGRARLRRATSVHPRRPARTNPKALSGPWIRAIWASEMTGWDVTSPTA